MKLLQRETYRGHNIEIYERRIAPKDAPLGIAQSDEIIRIDGVTQMRSGLFGESVIAEARRLIDDAEEETAHLYSPGYENRPRR